MSNRRRNKRRIYAKLVKRGVKRETKINNTSLGSIIFWVIVIWCIYSDSCSCAYTPRATPLNNQHPIGSTYDPAIISGEKTEWLSHDNISAGD